MDCFLYVGFLFALVGGMSLDSEGNGYVIALILCGIGFLSLSIYLIYTYRNIRQIERNKQNRIIERMIERERRRGA